MRQVGKQTKVIDTTKSSMELYYMLSPLILRTRHELSAVFVLGNPNQQVNTLPKVTQLKVSRAGVYAFSLFPP